MADNNYSPNSRYDIGDHAAGCGRAPVQATLQSSGTNAGYQKDGTMASADYGPGQHCAGSYRNNPGPNVIGAPRSVNNT